MDIAIIILLVISIFTSGSLRVKGYDMNVNWPVLVILILFIIKIS